tara:strand:+ start:309 stop:554 length:246 start_codon:yes stop_codon:yes gene_type:complete
MGAAGERFIRLINNLTRPVDRDPMGISVAFIILNSEHRLVTAGLAVLFNDVLIDVDALFQNFFVFPTWPTASLYLVKNFMF